MTTGAPTIALKTAGAPLGGITKPATTQLPKATVPLNSPTKPLSPTSVGTRPAATTYDDSDVDETGAETATTVLAGVGLALALVVLGIQLKISNTWISVEDNIGGGWGQLFE